MVFFLISGGVPNGYSLISKRRYKEMMSLNETERIQFLEFHRDGWTFHGKGLWAFIQKIDSVDKGNEDLSPFLTLIGSPNFGKRSVYRDMEAQVGIVTVNKRLTNDLLAERDKIRNDTTKVNLETYNEEDRKIVWWVYLIATFLNVLM